MVATSSLDPRVGGLYRRFQGALLRLAALQGRAREFQLQNNRLSKSVSLAKARLELAPQAAEVFTYLQDKAHRRAVGEFEDLLSAFVDDVIPEAGSIRLEIGTERSAPALDILLDNGGDLEDIVNGNGGALTNVVVTGLGYAALSRTRNRQLMVLDEPDCWIKASNVPAFTKVVAEVANPVEEPGGAVRTGCQTLMISHNDIALMDDGAHIQELRIERDVRAFAARMGVDVVEVGTPGPCAYVVWVEPKHGKPTIEVRYRADGDEARNALTKGYPVLASIAGARPWRDNAQTGVRWIEASNLRSHLHTRLELSSGLNVLTGGVNAGKSNLYFTALRALAYGESDDSMIRHGADACIIRVGLERGVVLEMVRVRKGSPKVIYRRFEGGALVHEGRQETRGDVPNFVSEVLRIARVDDLDIQLRSQKQPVFLLTEGPARRAQLLSVGREAGLLQELIERQRLQVRRDRDSLKREEVELNHVNRMLSLLAPLSGMAALADIIAGLHEEALASGVNVAGLRQVISRLAPLEARARLWGLAEAELGARLQVPVLQATAPLANVIARLLEQRGAASLPDMPPAPPAPALHDTKPLGHLANRLSGLRSRAALADIPQAPPAPHLTATEGLGLLVGRLQSGALANSMLQRVPACPALPRLVDTAGLRALGVALTAKATAAQAAAKELAEATAEDGAARRALHDLRHELGVCPTCNKPFDDAPHEV